jgi:hypothetical protein
MKKRLFAVFISFVLLLSLLPTVAQAAQLKGQLGFATISTALSPGNMTAVCYLTTTPEDEVLFAAAYYLADGTLINLVSDSDEGFAEFARLYWLSYGNRDLEIGVKQLYPNRFSSFNRMLTKIGCTGEILY